MPEVINGTGTWYLGKSNVHTIRAECEFCHRTTNLKCYDTRLFVVLFFIPIIPLGKKRILNECSACTKHNVAKLSDWNEARKQSLAQLRKRLKEDGDNPETLKLLSAATVSYQERSLLFAAAPALAKKHSKDPEALMSLGQAFTYFESFDKAEKVYKRVLSIQDSPEVREHLSFVLLKQERPDEARTVLQPILDQKLADSAGAVYYLVKGYQAEGRHEEALALMDERDAAFPQFRELSEYVQQRKVSEKLFGTNKRVTPSFLSDNASGHDQGDPKNYTTAIVLAAVVGLAIPLYLGAAIWLGYNTKVFLVNGTSSPYSVVVEGTTHSLPASSASSIAVSQGNVDVSSPVEPDPLFPPFHVEVHTPFWTRPIWGRTFVINPDRSAVVIHETAIYGIGNVDEPPDPTVFFGDNFYNLPPVHYEFVPFPASITVEEKSDTRRTRVAFAPGVTDEDRFDLLQTLEPDARMAATEQMLRLDGDNSKLLYWYLQQIPSRQAIEFLKTGLRARPVRVEWHRAYQSLVQERDPKVDLRPEYRKLLAEDPKDPNLIYLLGRVEPDLQVSEKAFLKAATSSPPSPQALLGMGYIELCRGNFDSALKWTESAIPLLNDRTRAQDQFNLCLLAKGKYSDLIRYYEAEYDDSGDMEANIQLVRINTLKKNLREARHIRDEMLDGVPAPNKEELKSALDQLIAVSSGNINEYLRLNKDKDDFFRAFLSRDIPAATALADSENTDPIVAHALLYIEAQLQKEVLTANKHWTQLISALNNGDQSQRQFAQLMKSRDKVSEAIEFPIDPAMKRVLLLALGLCYPDARVLPMVRKLNFQGDVVSLYLKKID